MTSIAQVFANNDVQGSTFARALGRIGRFLILAARIRRERDQLAGLSNEQLRDIGVTRDGALRESDRAFLDIPAHRKSRMYL